MPEPLRNSRIGLYECSIDEGKVAKGRYIRGDYVGVFTWADLISKIIPDLEQNDRIRGFTYPILVISWRLRGDDPSKGSLGISRRSNPQPRRRKIPRTERWEAVIDDSGLATRVVGQKLVDPL